MNFRTLILRSLTYHARSHLGVILGSAIGAAVLIGALIVGDSVRTSLKEMALARLGKIDHAMVTNDRLFRQELADDLSTGETTTVPVLMLPGVAINSESEVRADRVQVVGVNERFWQLADATPKHTALAEDQIILNRSLAERLEAKIGDSIVIRVPKISSLSRDAPMAPQDDDSSGIRFQVAEIIGKDKLGRFSLQANQIPPYNAFIPLARLQERANATNRANLMLVSGPVSPGAIKAHWKLADADLELRRLTNSPMVELRSPQVFLDPPVVDAASSAFPEASRLQTYFVNRLSVGQNSAVYSMVTAAGPPWVPADMSDDEILVNKLLASEIESNPGTELTMTYNIVGHGRKLEEHTNVFRVHKVVGMDGIYRDPTLMPDFPGMTDAESCRDWDTGFDVDLQKLSDSEQDYWDRYRGTPKAYVTAKAGEQMWNNRFGNHTAVRIPGTNTVEIETALLAQLSPASMGFVFQPIRKQALIASSSGQDFGGLFIGFSFFLISAALILVSMLFQFSVEQRSTEVGTLLAMGYQPKQVRKLLLGEGVGLATFGSLIGLAGGIYYAQGMLHGLSTIWRNAVGTSELNYHASPGTLAGGLIGAILVAAFSLWLALRKQAAQPARELLAENDGGIGAHDARKAGGKRNFYIGTVALLTALGMTGWAFSASASAKPGAFFGAGALLLVAALCFTGVLLSMLEQAGSTAAPSLAGLGVRNVARRRRRSMATTIMLACGCFLVLSIGAFRLDENLNSNERGSGTGGFLFIGDSAVAIRPDLNAEGGKEALGLDPEDFKDVGFVQLRLRAGDDASCLNLNKAQRPRILGVNPDALSERKAFRFASTIDGKAKDDPWSLLKIKTADGAIPAIGDNASLMWALKTGVGKDLEYPDPDERGKPIKFRLVGGLANSILQGSLIIDEDIFAERFPSQTGYQSFLIDGPPAQADTIKANLTHGLRDNGLELTRTTKRLAQFNAVQNTYLGTFQILGSLGLLLGSAGLGVVVLRNVLERRGELAVMMALGFKAGSLKRLVITEHVALLLLGLFSGIGAAVIAVIPAIQAPASDLPYDKLILTLVGVLVSGIIFTWLASLWALRGKTLDSLRNN
jgi:putative ABC transport system permease protein